MTDLNINSKVFRFEMPRRPKLTFGSGSIPSYFIIGAQKAGTTSLQMDLCLHPYVKAPKLKELYYFSHASDIYDLKYYQSFFPKCKNGIITGDATANYLESEIAAKRIKNTAPNSKIICLLRNPIDRAYSHYLMSVKYGFESESFERALELEKERINSWRKPGPNLIKQRMGYREKGKYIMDIERWLQAFDKESIYFIKSESYFNNTQLEYDSLCVFLGLSNYRLEKFNWAKQKDKRVPMNESTRKKLSEYYQPYNERLRKLIGEEFSW